MGAAGDRQLLQKASTPVYLDESNQEEEANIYDLEAELAKGFITGK